MYMMTSTRCGISAKQLEREIGVSYRTAWRMLNKIRTELMEQDEKPLYGDVEVDETAGGGKIRASDRGKGEQYVRAKVSRRPTIWAAVERGGRVKAHVVKSRASADVEAPIYRYVLPVSMIFTDNYVGYDAYRLSRRFIGHRRIRHSEKIYVSGGVHTQTVEGFFGNMKNGIRGTYHSVSSKWLPSYLNGYVWRYNERSTSTRSMFETLLDRAAA
jgi:transposase